MQSKHQAAGMGSAGGKGSALGLTWAEVEVSVVSGSERWLIQCWTPTVTALISARWGALVGRAYVLYGGGVEKAPK